MAKKILVINGSPKKDKSVTIVVTNAFVKGVCSSGEYTSETINVNDLTIKTCIGCQSCCSRTNGECIIRNDDGPMVRQKIMEADIIILSFPLYFFGLPGSLKMLLDRQLGLLREYRGQATPEDGESLHGFRFDMKGKKLMWISSCAWTDVKAVYDPLFMEFDCIVGKGNYNYLICPQLKTLVDQGMRPRLIRYLANFEEAGKEYAISLKISDETRDKLNKTPYSETVYKQMLEMHWDNDKEEGIKAGLRK